MFGKNSATYKFAFAKALLEQVSQEKTKISLSDLAEHFSRNVIEHLKQSDKPEVLPLVNFYKHVGLI